VDNGYIYCGPDYSDNGGVPLVNANTWYAPLSSGGIGAWKGENNLLSAIFLAEGSSATKGTIIGLWSPSCFAHKRPFLLRWRSRRI